MPIKGLTNVAECRLRWDTVLHYILVVQGPFAVENIPFLTQPISQLWDKTSNKLVESHFVKSTTRRASDHVESHRCCMLKSSEYVAVCLPNSTTPPWRQRFFHASRANHKINQQGRLEGGAGSLGRQNVDQAPKFLWLGLMIKGHRRWYRIIILII